MFVNVNSVFVRDPSEPVELGMTKEEAPILDGYRFHLLPHIQAAVEMSLDPQDGNRYSLLIGIFIDGAEATYVTDWLQNADPQRIREYAFEVPGYEKYFTPKKAHKVEIKLGKRKLLQYFRKREYDLYESEPYYYRVGVLPG